MTTGVRAFRRTCHEVARRTGGSVREFRISDGVAPNFHEALIGCPGRTVSVICHRGQPLLAIAEPPDVDNRSRDTGPLTFIETPSLADVLATESGFRVLTAHELSAPFDATAWPDISAEDVRYWKPATLGEALFNHWD